MGLVPESRPQMLEMREGWHSEGGPPLSYPLWSAWVVMGGGQGRGSRDG